MQVVDDTPPTEQHHPTNQVSENEIATSIESLHRLLYSSIEALPVIISVIENRMYSPIACLMQASNTWRLTAMIYVLTCRLPSTVPVVLLHV